MTTLELRHSRMYSAGIHCQLIYKLISDYSKSARSALECGALTPLLPARQISTTFRRQVFIPHGFAPQSMYINL